MAQTQEEKRAKAKARKDAREAKIQAGEQLTEEELKQQEEDEKDTTPKEPAQTTSQQGTGSKPKEESEKITVDKAKLDAVLDRMDKLEEDNKILRDAVNRGRLQEAEDKRKVKGNPRVFLKIFTSADLSKHLITSWISAPENRILYSPSTGLPVGEVLEATYYFADGGDTGKIEQVRVTRIDDLAFGEVIGYETDEKGDPRGYYIVKMDDITWGDKPLKIHNAFVNP